MQFQRPTAASGRRTRRESWWLRSPSGDPPRRGRHRPHLCGRLLRGQGAAGRLVEAAVAQLRRRDMKAVPTCSYAQRWFQDHPEQGDLLADSQ